MAAENVAIVADVLLYSVDPFEIAGLAQGVIRPIVPGSELRALSDRAAPSPRASVALSVAR
ncbi:MAG: hypothetical protein ACO3RU_10835 [Planctomycetota bacterium]